MMHSTSSQRLQPLSHSSTTRFPASALPFNHIHQNLPAQSNSSVILASQLTSSEPLFPLSNAFSVESQPGTFLADINSENPTLDPLGTNYYGFSHDLGSGIDSSPANLWYNPSTPSAPMTGSLQRDCNINVNCSSGLGCSDDAVQIIPACTSSTSKTITSQ
ncbi:Transcription factor E2-alpha [Schistosoma japonicum]|uniref:Transcription factor E2-alpha n=1 Tax=Schistosoma japonicum TaxID=6182 RepID=A0A4Z2DKK8_SCHJA|nr:Transcription factor E2-alpha [Schistosoma japonicum]